MSIGAIASLASSVIHPLYAAMTNHRSNSQTRTAPEDSPVVSRPAQFLSRLHQLSQTDPARFKHITGGLANDVRHLATQANAAGNSSQADGLNQLAQSFQTASETGRVPTFGQLSAHQGVQGAYSQGQSNPLDLLPSLS